MGTPSSSKRSAPWGKTRASPCSGGADAAVRDEDVVLSAKKIAGGTLRSVLNATGVIVHTNLGRAPLAPEALARVYDAARGYSNLELDLEDGERGAREGHL